MIGGCHPTLRRRLGSDRRGAALIEMAIALPVLLMLLVGIISYGMWLTDAHALQQSANEAARAALAGLTPDERATIARSTAADTVSQYSGLDAAQLVVAVQDDGTTLSVTVAYDVSRQPLMKLSIVPLPDKTIARTASVRLSGL